MVKLQHSLSLSLLQYSEPNAYSEIVDVVTTTEVWYDCQLIVYTVSMNVLKLYLGSHVLMNIVILGTSCAYESCYLRFITTNLNP